MNKIYLIAMIISILFAAFIIWGINSSYRSILFPINIPIKFDFLCVQTMNPGLIGRGIDHPYQIVVLKRDGSEFLRIQPEDAKDLLQISDLDFGSSADLKWGNSPGTLRFIGDESHEDHTGGQFKPFGVILKNHLSVDFTASKLNVIGSEGSFQGVLRIIKGPDRDGISLQNLSWTFGGSPIPIKGGLTETGPWSLTTYPETKVTMKENQGGKNVKIKYISYFDSPNLYAEDLVTKKKIDIPFETDVSGSFTPYSSQIASYIHWQIMLEIVGWIIPVGILFTVFYMDHKYRKKINRRSIKAV